MIISSDRLTKKVPATTQHEHLPGTNQCQINMQHSDQESKTYMNHATDNNVASSLPSPSLISQLNGKKKTPIKMLQIISGSRDF